MVPPQFIPLWGPHGILTDPQAVPGPTRLCLLFFQQSRSERNSISQFSLPCTNRQFSGRKMIARTGFHHCVYFIKCTIFPWQSQREEPTTISKKRRAFLCILTWTLVRGRKNSRRHILKGHTIWCGLNNL